MSYRNKSWLYERYIIQEKSIAKIAEEVGVAWNTIERWIINHGFEKKNKINRVLKTNVSYKPLHQWVRNHKPRVELCENCQEKKRLVIANITGVYDRDFDNYKWLCYKCHSELDGFKYNLKQYR